MGCKLPCWWGITPGEGTWEDVSSVFQNVGAPPLTFGQHEETAWFDLYIAIVPESAGPPLLAFGVFEEAGIINRIDASFALHHSPPNGYGPLDQAAERYSLQGLLLEVGPPTQVLLHAPGARSEPNAPWAYGIWLYFQDKAIAAYYEGEGMSLVNDKVRVCPTYELTHQVSLFLGNPASPATLQQMTSGSSSIPEQLNDGSLATLAQAASITEDEFYALLASDPRACLEVSPTS